jgi:16S rRNA (guanine527-N7)-methyltransferase
MWKGANYQFEINESANALTLLGARIREVYCYNLMGKKDRVIVVVEKTQATPAKYPRRIGVPAKRPL